MCDIVVESPDPHLACRRVLDAALYEWEERMSADNITVLVVEFDWGEEGSHSAASMELLHAGGNAIRSAEVDSKGEMVACAMHVLSWILACDRQAACGMS